MTRSKLLTARLAKGIKKVEEAMKGEDKAAIDAAVESLMGAAQKIGEKLNAQAQQAQQAQPQQGKAADDDVVDVDAKEK